MSIIELYSSRDYDVATGICIGRGYTILRELPRTIPKTAAPFRIVIKEPLTAGQVEVLKGQARNRRT